MKLHRSRGGRQSFFVVLVVLAGLLMLSAETLAAATYVPNEYIVTAAAGSTQTAVEKAVAGIGGVVVKRLPVADSYLVRLNVGSRSATRLTGSRAVYQPWILKTFSPNYIYKLNAATAVPTDPEFTKQWDMGLINMPRAWGIQKGSASVTVAVIDTGVATHPDLEGRVIDGYDFIDNDADPSNDMVGHGTHVSGTIAAQGGNDMGICGVCWEGVQILPVRVFGTASTTTDILIQGEDYALQQGADVVNMSYGGGNPDPIHHAKIIEMDNAGMILCASAGNDGATFFPDVGYPAAWDECIAVASVGPEDEWAYYSSYGPGNEVDIAAPGGDAMLGEQAMVYSTMVEWSGAMPFYIYDYMQGTSMACPHVAGAAALLLSNGVPPSEVRERLESSARKPGQGTMDVRKFGKGILDLAGALTEGSLNIAKPIKGSTVTDYPDFKINVRGIVLDSIKILVDYADEGEDGTPDDISSEIPVLEGVSATAFLNSTNTAFLFNWADTAGASAPMTAGLHFIYVTAQTTAGDTITDWGTFTVSANVLSRGTYLVALPYAASLDIGDGLRHPLPQEILYDAGSSQPLDFRSNSPTRSRLIRWSALDGQYLYYLPDENNDPAPNERSWMNIISPFFNAPTGGGYLPGDPTLQFPAGAGFWLILQQDAVITNTIPALSAPNGLKIPLYRGWNLIGNPFTRPVALSNIRLWYQGETRTLQQDQDKTYTRNPWVQGPSGQSSQFFGYSSNQEIPGYVPVPWVGGKLQPYQGYWIRSLKGGSLPQDTLYLILQL